MPRNHKPSKVSQAVFQRNGGKYSVSSNGHHCPESPTGSHWWQIETPRGETSVGVCRYCSEQKEFANTLKAAFNVGAR